MPPTRLRRYIVVRAVESLHITEVLIGSAFIVRVCVRACLFVCVCACVRACVRACVCVCVLEIVNTLYLHMCHSRDNNNVCYNGNVSEWPSSSVLYSSSLRCRLRRRMFFVFTASAFVIVLSIYTILKLLTIYIQCHVLSLAAGVAADVVRRLQGDGHCGSVLQRRTTTLCVKCRCPLPPIHARW